MRRSGLVIRQRMLQLTQCYFLLLGLASCAHLESAPKIMTGPGPEDLILVQTASGNDALVIGSAKRAMFSGTRTGRLELLSLAEATQQFSPQPVLAGFRPVGLYSAKTTHKNQKQCSKPLVYAVNTLPEDGNRRSVEVFGLDNGTLHHLEWLSTKPTNSINKANGLAVSEAGRIYVSNFGLFTFGKRTMRLPDENTTTDERNDSVVMYNPRSKTWKHILLGLNGPNGLELVDQGRILLVAEYYTKKVHAFSLDADGLPVSDKPLQSVELDFHPDNMKRLDSDLVSVTGQFRKISVFLHLIFPRISALGESTILRVRNGEMCLATPSVLSQLGFSDRDAPSTLVRTDTHYFISHILRGFISKVRRPIADTREPQSGAERRKSLASNCY